MLGLVCYITKHFVFAVFRWIASETCNRSWFGLFVTLQNILFLQCSVGLRLKHVIGHGLACLLHYETFSFCSVPLDCV
jgi:hypothetical protein